MIHYLSTWVLTASFNTTLVRSTFGSVSCSAAQRSDMVLNKMLIPLYSKEYRKANAKVFKKEMKEMRKAIRLNQGSRIMSQLCCYADEYKTCAEKWNLWTIYKDYCKEQDITFHLIGSDQEPFEGDQLAVVHQRMKEFLSDGNIVAETAKGGNKLATEQPAMLVDRIVLMVQRAKSSHKKPQKAWAQTTESPNARASWTSASPRDSYVDYGLAF